MTKNKVYERVLSTPVIAVIGSHSALDVCEGAYTEGLKNLVLAEKGRELLYTKYFYYRKYKGIEKGFINEVITLNKFSEILNPGFQESMLKRNVIMVPNRSLTSYIDVVDVEKKLMFPIFGSRDMLYIEERTMEKNYYWMAEKAGINTPKEYKDPKDIDRLVIVKLPHAVKRLERGFFTCSSYKEYKEKSNQLLKSNVIKMEDLKKARIEEYVIGPVFNFDFFWSPLDNELELLGIDWRFETSLDGFVRLPAIEQILLPKKYQIPEYTVIGHASSTLRESSLDKIFSMGEKIVEFSKKHFTKGMIGPFTIQTILDKDLNPYMYDFSPRIGGGTNIHMAMGHPYGNGLHRKEMSTGRRIALEIKRAYETNDLPKVLT
ncbi:MAG: formate--phosphoribosylaminoimidazolecarboxamide ligase family protein [Thermoplasmata archaeon]